MSEITLKNISVSPPKTKVKRSLASRGRLKLGNTVSQASVSPAFDQSTNRPSKILTIESPAKELTLVVNGVRESISISPDRSARKRSTILKIPLEGRRFSSVGNHLNGVHKLQANTPELKKTAEEPQDFKTLTFMRGLVNNWRRNLDDLTNEELTELAIFSLKKDPETRAIQDTNVLTQYLSEISFFQTFEKSLLEQCVQHFHDLLLPKGTTVFRMDDTGTNMFVLLKGSVGVWSHKGTEEAPDHNKKEFLRKSMIETKVLSSGAIFGEHTLTNNSTRPYTIICKESCQVAVFEKQDYFNVLAQTKAEKLAEEIKFLGSIPLFKFFTERTLKMFASILPSEKYLRGHKVYQEADEPQSMYIVKKGEFKMLKSVVEGKGENNNGKRESLSKLKRTQKKRKNIEICLIGEHEMFGEDELVQEVPRSYTIVCNSTEAEVYRIDKKILFEKIFKSSSTSKWLKGYSEWKAKYYEDRIKTLSTPAGINQNMGDNYDSRDYLSNNGYESLPKPAHIRNMSEALIQGFDPSATASPRADRSLKLSMEISKKSPGLDSPKVRIDGIEIENSFIAMSARRNPSTPYERRFNKNQFYNDSSIENSQNSEGKKKEEESRKIQNFKSFSDRYNLSTGAVRAGPDVILSERKEPETNNPFKAFRGFLTNDALEKSTNRPKTGGEEMGKNFPSKKLDKLPSSDDKTDHSPRFQDILKELRAEKSNKSIFTAANFGFTQTSNKAASVPVRQNSANILGNRNTVPQQVIITPILSPRHQHSIIAYNKAVVGSSRESPNISSDFSKQANHEVQNIHMSKLRSSKSAKSLRPFGKTSLDLKKKKVVDLMKISQINNFYEKPNLFNTPIIPAFGFQGSQTTRRPNSKGFLSERQIRIPIDEVNEEDRNFSITNRQWERGY